MVWKTQLPKCIVIFQDNIRANTVLGARFLGRRRHHRLASLCPIYSFYLFIYLFSLAFTGKVTNVSPSNRLFNYSFFCFFFHCCCHTIKQYILYFFRFGRMGGGDKFVLLRFK